MLLKKMFYNVHGHCHGNHRQLKFTLRVFENRGYHGNARGHSEMFSTTTFS